MLDSRKVLVLAAGAILFYQLIVPPVVGLADNGDFAKIIARFDLYARVHRTYEFADTVYEFRPETHWASPFYSLEIPLAYSALRLSSAFSKDGKFDLRFVGAVHAMFFLAAIWLFAPLLAGARPWMRWTMYVLVLWVYCDVMYVSSLNSFYMDEPAYLFLLLTAVMCLRVLQGGRKRDAILLMLCPFLLVIAKAQHALIGWWAALMFFAAGKVFYPIRPRRWYAAGVCLVVSALLMLWKAQPADYASWPLYSVTFEEILPHSGNVDRTLADLGLDDSYRFCIGKKAFVPDSGMDDPDFRQRFMQRLSFPKLAMFYARHPRTTYQTLDRALSEAGRQRAFGNFDASTGYAPSTESRAFALWSDLKRNLFYHHGSRFLFTFLALSALLCLLLRLERQHIPKGASPAGLCLIGAAFTEMGLSMLCDSMDIVRHGMIFFVLFDMIALACAYLALHGINFRKSSQALAMGEIETADKCRLKQMERNIASLDKAVEREALARPG